MNPRTFSLLMMILFSLTGWGQDQFVFYKNSTNSTDLFSSSSNGVITALGSRVKIRKNKLKIPSNYYTYSVMPKEILDAIPIEEGMVFYSALQSTIEKNKWLFVERSMQTFAYNVCLFDSGTKTKKIIFTQNSSPDKNFAFKPFAWSNSKDVVYLEALIFGSATENEGVWSYNLKTRRFSKLPINPSYLITPIISPDGNFFIYGANSEDKSLDSYIDQVFLFDISRNREMLVSKDKNSSFFIGGWVKGKLKKEDIIGILEEDDVADAKVNIYARVSQPSFKLPWPSGYTYCVTRTGGGAVPQGKRIITPMFSIGSHRIGRIYVAFGSH